MNRLSYIYAVAILANIVACGGKEKGDANGHSGDIRTETTVETMTLRRSSFSLQLVCNGRLQAIARSEISFPSQGVVTRIYVHNGSRVAKGQLLAKTDKREKQAQLEKARVDMEKATIDLADKLIGQGYDANGTSVPADVMRRMKLASGYYSSHYQLTKAKKDLADCELYAPFGGRVADMDCQPFQQASKFGLLIDDSYFDVKFSILEAELKSVCVGQTVKVSPFVDASKTFVGKVMRINPTVDEKGMVKIEARIRNTDQSLIDGMNVKVVVEKTVTDRIVVPKSAVVERDGYHVIFEVEDSVAVWTYVDIEHTNTDSYAITGCKAKNTTVSEGERIITSNIQNLADGTIVRLKK